MSESILRLELVRDDDVVLARRRAREIAGLLGFDARDQSRIATALSEIARNAVRYGGGGRVEFTLGQEEPRQLLVRVADHGGSGASLAQVLDARSQEPGGSGIANARHLMDHFDVAYDASGTTIVLGKTMPKPSGQQSPMPVAELSHQLEAAGPDLAEEIQRQDQELLDTLGELRLRQAEVERLSRELEETNRGVVALYMELDQRAEDLARSADFKSRVLADMSHEIRTPLNAILNVTRLLTDRVDGDLTPEQERQVRLIRNSAHALSELVNDLLELARMEAGKTVVRLSEFSVSDTFAALRGVFRPMLPSDAVELVFEDASALPTLHTDEGKLSQILRNLISNALKFTERGEVRVAAALRGSGQVVFTVADTGIGIAPGDQERIFQEFTQIDNPLQRRAQGTGLGLPLSRKLAEFLGGSLSVSSASGRGSIFTATIPREYREDGEGDESVNR